MHSRIMHPLAGSPDCLEGQAAAAAAENNAKEDEVQWNLHLPLQG